jgi:hypothetical protein
MKTKTIQAATPSCVIPFSFDLSQPQQQLSKASTDDFFSTILEILFDIPKNVSFNYFLIQMTSKSVKNTCKGDYYYGNERT